MRGQYDQKFIPLRGFLTCVFLLMVFSLLLGVSLCSSLDEFLDNGNHEHKHKQKHGHHKHHGHGHHNAHQPKKGIDYFLHHESHLTEYDWNSFAPANPKPKVGVSHNIQLICFAQPYSFIDVLSLFRRRK